MKRVNFWKLLPIVLLAAGFTSCKKDDPAPPKATYGSGVFIVNEGPFENGTGSISFLNRETGGVEQDVFERVNGRPLGNIAQSMASFGTIGMLVVNNANKVEFVDLQDFKSIGVIENLAMPSQMVVAGNTGKAYLTEWVAFGSPGRVAVIDIAARNVIKTIAVGEFPNAIHFHNNRVYVANSNENTITEITTSGDSVLQTYTVGNRPNSFRSWEGGLYVLCGGTPSWAGTETPGALARLQSGQISIRNFTSASMHPDKLNLHAASGAFLYNMGGAIYSLDQSVTGDINPSQAVIDRSFYHFAADPSAGGLLYGTDARGFSGNGWVYRYSQQFVLRDSIPVGLGPGYIYFR
ncbi:MAG: YncE family protein [Bacteroidia bacterium]